MNKKDFLSSFKLHLSVVLFGAVALFPKLIFIHPILLVWGRCFFAALFLLFWILLIKKINLKVNYTDFFKISFLNGFVLAVHWVLFFLSIKLSTVALGVITFSTFPLFIVFAAPLFKFGKIEKRDIITSLVIFIGVLVMVRPDKLESNYMLGLFCGLGAALSFALLTILNKKFAKDQDAVIIAFFQNLGASIFLIPSVFIFESNLTETEFLYWVILGVVFTALAHTIFVSSLRNTSIQHIGFITALEPVYAIIWAILFFKEWPLNTEWIGAFVILSAVLINTKKRHSPVQENVLNN